jgi:hypothetical protein
MVRTAAERSLVRILLELRPYLGDVVVVGGWVPYLYMRFGGFEQWTAQVSLTMDLDLLIGRPLPRGDRRPIAEILAGAGLSARGVTSKAAVWIGDVAHGERIEFLVPHTGTARDAGSVVSVGEQTMLGAISLEHLAILQRHTRSLDLHPGAGTGYDPVLSVTVPTLGAFLVNKASTFAQRGPADGVDKRSKDLLYIRDVLAAGDGVARRVDEDVTEMVRSDPSAAREVAYAASQVELALRGALSPHADSAARMLAAREPAFRSGDALADVTGYLTDFAEILRAARP